MNNTGSEYRCICIPRNRRTGYKYIFWKIIEFKELYAHVCGCYIDNLVEQKQSEYPEK